MAEGEMNFTTTNLVSKCRNDLNTKHTQKLQTHRGLEDNLYTKIENIQQYLSYQHKETGVGISIYPD